jgi:Sulfotransferase family
MNISPTKNKRFFLVGCPRSGTTLLQSLLASHTQIISFPESHFFCNLFGDYEPKRRLLGIASRRAKPCLEKFLKESGYNQPEQYLPTNLLFTKQYTRTFIRLLDQITHDSNKQIWLEKTPPHLHYISYIEKNVKPVHFIHIVRNGADVITSLYQLRNQFPDIWDGEHSQLSDCVDRWLSDVRITLQSISAPNHTYVRYESLVANPEATVTKLCHFIGIDFEPTMLTQYTHQAAKVSLKHETWKASTVQSIQDKNRQKFHALLTLEQQTYVLDRLQEFDLDQLLPG